MQLRQLRSWLSVMIVMTAPALAQDPAGRVRQQPARAPAQAPHAVRAGQGGHAPALPTPFSDWLYHQSTTIDAIGDYFRKFPDSKTLPADPARAKGADAFVNWLQRKNFKSCADLSMTFSRVNAPAGEVLVKEVDMGEEDMLPPPGSRLPSTHRHSTVRLAMPWRPIVVEPTVGVPSLVITEVPKDFFQDERVASDAKRAFQVLRRRSEHAFELSVLQIHADGTPEWNVPCRYAEGEAPSTALPTSGPPPIDSKDVQPRPGPLTTLARAMAPEAKALPEGHWAEATTPSDETAMKVLERRLVAALKEPAEEGGESHPQSKELSELQDLLHGDTQRQIEPVSASVPGLVRLAMGAPKDALVTAAWLVQRDSSGKETSRHLVAVSRAPSGKPRLWIARVSGTESLEEIAKKRFSTWGHHPDLSDHGVRLDDSLHGVPDLTARLDRERRTARPVEQLASGQQLTAFFNRYHLLPDGKLPSLHFINSPNDGMHDGTVAYTEAIGMPAETVVIPDSVAKETVHEHPGAHPIHTVHPVEKLDRENPAVLAHEIAHVLDFKVLKIPSINPDKEKVILQKRYLADVEGFKKAERKSPGYLAKRADFVRLIPAKERKTLTEAQITERFEAKSADYGVDLANKVREWTPAYLYMKRPSEWWGFSAEIAYMRDVQRMSFPQVVDSILRFASSEDKHMTEWKRQYFHHLYETPLPKMLEEIRAYARGIETEAGVASN